MILLEREPALPAVVETNKAQVILCLRSLHAIQDFDTVRELDDGLDQVLDELAVAGAPRGLSRILLFYRTPAAITAVAKRMLPGGQFLAFQAPACWQQMAAKLPELRAWAERAEPGWTTQPKGI